MPFKEKLRHILVELKGHAPFTCAGALLGVLFMLLFKNLTETSSHTLFAVFHPAHVVLSAMVTASMFKLHALKKRFILVLVVGYVGSIGIATLSDIVIPHIGSKILNLNIPSHAQVHHHGTSEHDEHDEHINDTCTHDDGIHLSFIEEWYIVNPAALLGILIAFFLPRTKFPHSAHILISTWASLSYLLMNLQADLTIALSAGIFITLFIATWLPCCISDIIFPLLFVKSDIELVNVCSCKDHSHHSHPHKHKHSEKCPTGKEEK